jgi:hypothetical protein
LSEKAEHLEASMDEKSQEYHELLDSKLGDLSQGINKIYNRLLVQEQLSEKAEHLEASMDEKSQEYHELLDSKLGNLSQGINMISDKLLFVMDQNEASIKRILILERIIEELSGKSQEFGNDAACNSEERQELETEVLDYDERPTSLKQTLETKASGLSHRVRSAIIGGGLGVIIVLMILKIV